MKLTFAHYWIFVLSSFCFTVYIPYHEQTAMFLLLFNVSHVCYLSSSNIVYIQSEVICQQPLDGCGFPLCYALFLPPQHLSVMYKWNVLFSVVGRWGIRGETWVCQSPISREARHLRRSITPTFMRMQSLQWLVSDRESAYQEVKIRYLF